MFLGPLLSFLLTTPASAGKPYLPSSVPVNFRPDENEGRLLSVGLNRMVVGTEWEDNFFSPRTERIGKNKVTSTGFALGLIRGRGPRYSEEWDLLAGTLDFAAVTRRYRSAVINKDVDVDARGKGFDFGTRYLGGWSLSRSQLTDSLSADWTVALSLHALLYSLKNRYQADSADLLDSNHYEERDLGLFLRPSLSFQPLFDIGKTASVVPFVGLSGIAIGTLTDYQDTVFRRNGVAGKLTESTDLTGQARGPEFILGFDLAVRPRFLRGHRVLIGGALTKLYGGADGDFSELHLAYSFPLGSNRLAASNANAR